MSLATSKVPPSLVQPWDIWPSSDRRPSAGRTPRNFLLEVPNPGHYSSIPTMSAAQTPPRPVPSPAGRPSSPSSVATRKAETARAGRGISSCRRRRHSSGPAGSGTTAPAGPLGRNSATPRSTLAAPTKVPESDLSNWSASLPLRRLSDRVAARWNYGRTGI